jgi:uncharacterized membrane protein YkoI
MSSKVILATLAMAAVAGLAQADDAKSELQTLDSAKVSLTDAIQKAEQEGMGKAIDVEIESDRGQQPHYAVEVLSSDGKTITEYEVDAMTGTISGARTERFENVFKRTQSRDLAQAETQTSLTQAISTAESQSGGKAIEAETEREDARVRYEIKIAQADGSTEELEVDGASGKVARK